MIPGMTELPDFSGARSVLVDREDHTVLVTWPGGRSEFFAINCELVMDAIAEVVALRPGLCCFEEPQ